MFIIFPPTLCIIFPGVFSFDPKGRIFSITVYIFEYSHTCIFVVLNGNFGDAYLRLRLQKTFYVSSYRYLPSSSSQTFRSCRVISVMALLTSSIESNVRLLRQLADLTSRLPASSLTDAVALLDHCETFRIFSSASTEDAAHVVECIGMALSSDHSDVHAFALRVTASFTRSLPPVTLAQHWYVLMQRVLAIFKVSGFSSYPARKRAQVFSCAAAIIKCSAPCIRLGGEQKAHAVITGQVLLRHAIQTLSQSPISAPLALSALSAVFAVVVSTPRELRASLSQLDCTLRDNMFVHSSNDVREAAASLYAHLVTSVPEKVQGQTYIDRLSLICNDLEDVQAVIDAFIAGGDKHRKPLHRQDVIHLPAVNLSRLFSAACSAIIAALAVHLPLRSPFPVSRVIHILCTALYPRSIDPYAVGCEEGALDAEGALSVSATITDDALTTLSTLLFSIERDVVVPYGGIILKAFRARLKSLMLQVHSDRSSIATCPMRALLYDVLVDAITVFGSAVIDETVPFVARLLQTDISLYLQCRSARNDESTLDLVNGTVSSNALRTRKRKRAAKFGEHTASEDRVTIANKLGDMCSDDALGVIRLSFDSGLCVVRAMFDCRGAITANSCDHLRSIETLLMRCIESGAIHDIVISAATAAAISGGSNRMEAFASKLLKPCGQLVAELFVRNFVPAETRRAAFSARSMYEPIIHPRGPQIRKVPRLQRAENSLHASHSGSNYRGVSHAARSKVREQIVSAPENDVVISRESGSENAQPMFNLLKGSQDEHKAQKSGHPVGISQGGNDGSSQGIETRNTVDQSMLIQNNSTSSRELDSVYNLANDSRQLSNVNGDPSEVGSRLPIFPSNGSRGETIEPYMIIDNSTMENNRAGGGEEVPSDQSHLIDAVPPQLDDKKTADSVKASIDEEVAPSKYAGEQAPNEVGFSTRTSSVLSVALEATKEDKQMEVQKDHAEVEKLDEEGEQERTNKVTCGADKKVDNEIQKSLPYKSLNRPGISEAVVTFEEGDPSNKPAETSRSNCRDNSITSGGTAVNAVDGKGKDVNCHPTIPVVDDSCENVVSKMDIDTGRNLATTPAVATDENEKSATELRRGRSNDASADPAIISDCPDENKNIERTTMRVTNKETIYAKEVTEEDGGVSTETEDLNCMGTNTEFFDQSVEPNTADQTDSIDRIGEDTAKEAKQQESESPEGEEEHFEMTFSSVEFKNNEQVSFVREGIDERLNCAVKKSENGTVEETKVQGNGGLIIEEQDIEITFSAVEPEYLKNIPFGHDEGAGARDTIDATEDCHRRDSMGQQPTPVLVVEKNLAEEATKLALMERKEKNTTSPSENATVKETSEQTAKKCETTTTDHTIPNCAPGDNKADETRDKNAISESAGGALDAVAVQNDPPRSEKDIFKDELNYPVNRTKGDMTNAPPGAEQESTKVRSNQLHMETSEESGCKDDERDTMDGNEDENVLINSLCFDAPDKTEEASRLG